MPDEARAEHIPLPLLSVIHSFIYFCSAQEIRGQHTSTHVIVRATHTRAPNKHDSACTTSRVVPDHSRLSWTTHRLEKKEHKRPKQKKNDLRKSTTRGRKSPGTLANTAVSMHPILRPANAFYSWELHPLRQGVLRTRRRKDRRMGGRTDRRGAPKRAVVRLSLRTEGRVKQIGNMSTSVHQAFNDDKPQHCTHRGSRCRQTRLVYYRRHHSRWERNYQCSAVVLDLDVVRSVIVKKWGAQRCRTGNTSVGALSQNTHAAH